MKNDYWEGYLKGVEDTIRIIKKAVKNVDDSTLEKIRNLIVSRVVSSSSRKPAFVIKYGSIVVIDEKDGKKVYSIFNQTIAKSSRAMCITYKSPASVSLPEDFRDKIEIVWLTEYVREGRSRTSSFAGQIRDKISPSDLSSLTQIINEFIEEERKRVVMIDNLNKIVMHVGKNSTSIPMIAKFLDNVGGCALENEGVLLLSVDLQSLEASLADQIKNLSSRIVK